ncbi:hypothetical protein ACWGDT_35110 [Streptomyces avermitilis]
MRLETRRSRPSALMLLEVYSSAMPAKAITAVYQRLLAQQLSISASLRPTLDRLAEGQPSLAAAVGRLLDSDGSTSSPFRLLPFPILGAFALDEDLALPVATLSRVWWTGAEVFDDLADGEFDAADVGLTSAQASTASTACLVLVPQAMIEQLGLPERLRSAWSQELLAGSLSAAEGQLEDLSAGRGAMSWAAVMRTYAGKSGAAYGRDAAMTAMLASADEVVIRGWRAFGKLFGVLRQLANDQASASATVDKDLANGTWTLLLALAVEGASTREAAVLEDLRVHAMNDLSARTALRRRLARSDILDAYKQRVGAIHRRLSNLLAEIAEPSEHRDLMQWMVDVSALDARSTAAAGGA